MWGINLKALSKVSTNISTIQDLKKAFSDNCDFGIFHILSVAAELKMMSYALFFCGHMKLSTNVNKLFLDAFFSRKRKTVTFKRVFDIIIQINQWKTAQKLSISWT